MSSASPTAYSMVIDGSADAAWFASTLTTKMRVVAMGLKVNTASSVDNTAGTLQATTGDSTALFNVYHSSYNSFATMTDTNDPQEFSCAEGITVRYDPLLSADSYSLHDGTTTQFYAPAAIASSSFNDMPRIEVRSPSAATVLRVDMVMYLECIPTDRSNCPLNDGYAPVSNDWPMVQRLLASRIAMPLVAHGHSFQDFLDGVGRFFKGVGQTIWKGLNNPDLMHTIGSVAKLIGGVVL